MMATRIAACAALILSAASAHAQFNLLITEIWPGNDPGDNLTADWFEVTNTGDVAWTTVDGDLYFDDVSMDSADAALLSGVASIAPGESVVFIDDDTTEQFATVWANVVLPQLGTYDGAGLGQGGDGVTLFLSTGAPTGVENIIDFQQYAAATGGQSWDVSLGAFSTVGNANGALQSAITNDVGQFAVASIGPAVPEPIAALLAALAGCGLVATRRR